MLCESTGLCSTPKLTLLALRSNLQGLPLTLFYTSIPTLFLLTISSLIWPAEYAPSPSAAPTPSAESSLEELLGPLASSQITLLVIKKLSWLSRERLKSGISRVGHASGWANEALLRKGVGGSSAVVGVSGGLASILYCSETLSLTPVTLQLCSIRRSGEQSRFCYWHGLCISPC